MKYRVTFYCPDRHIFYDGGRLPDTRGVGGGVNARIRLSQALAARGHEVTMICNCAREEVHLGVNYLPLDDVREIRTDILVMTTSGGNLSLEPLLDLKVTARLKILLLHGTPRPLGLDKTLPDYYYPPSNFIRDVMLKEWKNTPTKKIFVSHRGVMKKNFETDDESTGSQSRNKFRLAYVGHPSKGRKQAIEVLKILQQMDPRYHLYIFGDEGLWGGRAESISSGEQIKNFGMINQQKLAKELLESRFSIFLQTRLEPYSNAMLESLSAGCIPVASPVGGYKEQIIENWNGFFVDGHPDEPATLRKAAQLIHELQQDDRRTAMIEQNAKNSTYDWSIVALSWEQHWDIAAGHVLADPYYAAQACPACRGKVLHLADGYHCTKCGRYYKEL